jgi:hypothetical protein
MFSRGKQAINNHRRTDSIDEFEEEDYDDSK